MVIWPQGTNIYLANQLFSIMAQGGNAEYVVDGYPEYATESASLTGQQRNVLHDAADAIIRSQSTLSPVRAFLVIGHADRALRKPLNDRAAFELQVSEQRARSASQALMREVNLRAAGAHFAKVLHSGAIGFGNKRPVYLAAQNEAQMKRNRRVEILLARCQLAPPHCGV